MASSPPPLMSRHSVSSSALPPSTLVEKRVVLQQQVRHRPLGKKEYANCEVAVIIDGPHGLTEEDVVILVKEALEKQKAAARMAHCIDTGGVEMSVATDAEADSRQESEHLYSSHVDEQDGKQRILLLQQQGKGKGGHASRRKEGKAKKKCKQYFPRQRPRKACLSCISKKIKCSLGSPCHQCQKRGICCEYVNAGDEGKTTITARCDKAATRILCIKSVAVGEAEAAQEKTERVQERGKGEEEEEEVVEQGQWQEQQQEKKDDEREEEEEEEEEQEFFVPRYDNTPSSLSSSSSTSSSHFSAFRPCAPAFLSLPMQCPLYAHEQEEESEDGEEKEGEDEGLGHDDEDDADREVAFLLEMDSSLLMRHKGRLMRSPPIITHMSVATPTLPERASLSR